MEPREGKPTYSSDSEVICTSYYSKLNPLENGEASKPVLSRHVIGFRAFWILTVYGLL